LQQQGEKRAIFQTPSTATGPSFFNNYHNYAGYGLPHPYANYGHPSKRDIKHSLHYSLFLKYTYYRGVVHLIILGWSPMPSAPPHLPSTAPSSSPATMMSPSLFQHHKFGWFGPPPIPLATSTPLNPAFVSSTSSQLDASMMDVQKEASGELSGEAGNEKRLTEEMWGTTVVGNTMVYLR
jgi:hypothetical protein